MNDDVRALLYIASAGALLLFAGRAMLTPSKKIPETDDPLHESEKHDVALLGDSLTDGAYYALELNRLLGPESRVRAFSYPGKGARYIKRHIEDALRWNPTDIVVLAGTNDLASNRSPSHVISNLNDIYVEAREKGIRVVGVLLLPWGAHRIGKEKEAETAEVNDWISWSAPVDVVDTGSMGDGRGNLHEALAAEDGLHLNPLGQEALAQEVFIQAFALRGCKIRDSEESLDYH